MGVNDHHLNKDDKVVSNASCTTHCLAPMAKVLNDEFGIVSGMMTTIHAYTRDQSLVDRTHKDLRRGRAAAASLVPTTTGAASAIGKVIPELDGRLDGMAVRAPVPDGSLVDLVVHTRQEPTIDTVNACFLEASRGELRAILEYAVDPLVSSDVVGNSHSCVFDAESTMVGAEKLIKVCGWYDNEWGYAHRSLDLTARMTALAEVQVAMAADTGNGASSLNGNGNGHHHSAGLNGGSRPLAATA